MTIIERTLSFLITLLLYSRPKKEGTTSHVYGKRRTEICTTWPSFPLLVVYCFLYLLKCRASGYVSSLKSEIGLKIQIWILVKKRTLRFFDEDDYEYKIFSILSIGQAWTSVILAGKRDSRRHSTTSFSEEVVVAGTSYQMLESFSILVSGEGLTSCSINNPANFFGEKSTVKLSWVSFFVWEHEQKL